MVEQTTSDKEVIINEISLNCEGSAVAIATSNGYLVHEFDPHKPRANHKFEGGFARIVLARESKLAVLVPTGNCSTWSSNHLILQQPSQGKHFAKIVITQPISSFSYSNGIYFVAEHDCITCITLKD